MASARYELLHRQTWREVGGSQHAARSTVYGFTHALPLFAELEQRGLVDDGYRDVQSGRKVRTIVQEVSRLGPANPDADVLEALVADYIRLRDEPLRLVQTVVRNVLADRESG